MASSKDREESQIETAPTRLRAERLRRGWTLLYLTQATGISTSDLSQMEWGKRHAFPGWRKRLARAFGVPEEQLFPSPEEREARAS